MRFSISFLKTLSKAAAIVALSSGSAGAAELAGWFAGAVEPFAKILIPQFEASTGNKVTATYGVVGPIIARVNKGDIGDLIIVSPSDVEQLQKTGKIIAGTGIAIAKTGIGVAVPAGAAKPDLSTPDAFKRALLSAKTIGLADPNGGASSSKQIMHIFDQLGIAKEVLAKAKLVGGGNSMIKAMRAGEAEIGVYLISELSQGSGIDFIGPVPAELQFYVAYSGAVLKTSPNPAAAKALLDFLVSPAAVPTIRAKGLEPG